MKVILGAFLTLAGISLGVYVGFWLMFVGGILDIVEQVKGSVEPLPIGFGILKIIFAPFTGWLAGAVLLIPGWALLVE